MPYNWELPDAKIKCGIPTRDGLGKKGSVEQNLFE